MIFQSVIGEMSSEFQTGQSGWFTVSYSQPKTISLSKAARILFLTYVEASGFVRIVCVPAGGTMQISGPYTFSLSRNGMELTISVDASSASDINCTYCTLC